MTSGPSGTDVAELIQSRDASAPEALAICRAHMNAFKVRVAAVRGSVSRVWLLVGAGVIGAIVISIADAQWWQDLRPMYRVGLFALCAAVALRGWGHIYRRRCAEVYQHCFRADRTLRLEEHAIVATNASGVVSSVPWRAIFDIVADKDFLAIYLSPIEVLFLPKAACEHQDADRFCAELVRRWQAHRSLAGAVA